MSDRLAPGRYTLRYVGAGVQDFTRARLVYGTAYADSAGRVYVHAHLRPAPFAVLRRHLARVLLSR